MEVLESHDVPDVLFFLLVVYSLEAEMAESLHDFLWCIEMHAFLCTEHNGGRQSESSKCDSMGPFRHRHTKKENPHGCAYKSVNTEWFN